MPYHHTIRHHTFIITIDMAMISAIHMVAVNISGIGIFAIEIIFIKFERRMGCC